MFFNYYYVIQTNLMNIMLQDTMVLINGISLFSLPQQTEEKRRNSTKQSINFEFPQFVTNYKIYLKMLSGGWPASAPFLNPNMEQNGMEQIESSGKLKYFVVMGRHAAAINCQIAYLNK